MEPYCQYHNAALQKLRNEYPKWKNAFAEISWERYLESISKLEGTGQWAAEVARNELKHQQQRH
jgi:hypothetical protein